MSHRRWRGDLTSYDFSYIIAVEVSDFNGVPADLFTAEIPEAVYAIFTTPANDGEENSAPAIQGTWKYIHETWFPDSGYEFVEGKADFEWYPCSNKGEKVKIYIPIIWHQWLTNPICKLSGKQQTDPMVDTACAVSSLQQIIR